MRKPKSRSPLSLALLVVLCLFVFPGLASAQCPVCPAPAGQQLLLAPAAPAVYAAPVVVQQAPAVIVRQAAPAVYAAPAPAGGVFLGRLQQRSVTRSRTVQTVR